MRAGPLSDPSVAALLEEAFVCAWEKKGAVECYRMKGSPEQGFKAGGNILTYVCTPQGEVIHALPGVWQSVDYARELMWARSRCRELADLKTPDALAHVRAAHRERLSSLVQWEQGFQAHQLLSSEAFLPIAKIEKAFFERLLGETYAPDREIIIREVTPSDYRAVLATMRRG